MHLFLNIFVIFVTWKWADYKNWQKYHTTMLFLPIMSLVYDLISYSANFFLWDLKPDFFVNHAIVDFVYATILLPCTVLLFLSTYPEAPIKIVIHFLKYIIIYSAVEALLYILGRMDYQHGWSVWNSMLFYCLMFPAIAIHHKHPIFAYIVFVLFAIFGVWYYKIPIT